ncbi:Periplasmic dipeptide transport protein [Saliniradius amylolyticus]|uniref:Periplasmic dipeptide transport protein n=1 Tax=Saliniradius amylolyticus TaxID=2183582 RepID=A0A2S2E1D3_9ALTE|nr:ABC transporter substrate-binding protein SapA [Saliniradius amylolyticus]AWL11332.1 Periplasmic dipeptide transport protein [Saliniradius amylolyticus]
MSDYRLLLLLMPLLTFIAGCEQQSTRQLAQKGLVYCSEGNPATFNPQLDISGITVDATSHQLYNRLIRYNPETGQLEPELATSWLLRDDGVTYEFQLRKDVPFHSTPYFTPTRNFNVDDVIFTFDRWRMLSHNYHNVSGGSYPYFESLELSQVVEEVSRINGYRVKIKLSHPDSSFLASLATDFAIILSAEYAEYLEDEELDKSLIDRRPIGTGPYKFASFQRNSHIRYFRHPDYWAGPAKPEQLLYDITPTSSMRLAKLITGECDVAAYPAQTELKVIQEHPELTLDELPGLNVGFWAFNTKRPPFDNPKVRRALAMAIDKETLLDAVYFDSAVRAKGILPPTSWAYDQTQQEVNYNPVRARQLLEEAGFGEGFSMNIWALPVQRPYNPNARKMAEIMQRYLAEIGVSARIISYEWSNFRERLRAMQHDSVLIGWSADNVDPDNFYRPLLSCPAVDSGSNRANWCHPEFDKVLEQALMSADKQQRTALYRQANQILNDQMPLVPLAHAYRFQAYRKAVRNLPILPFGGIAFGGVSKEER